MRNVRCKLSELDGLITKDLSRLDREIKKAIAKTAEDAVPVIEERAPKAFGELRNSVHATKDATIVDAPHAASVEIGSRPHTPPLEPLIEWVKLRGLQGLTKQGQMKRSLTRADGKKIGPTTAIHALSVAAELRSMERDGASSIDAPRQIALRIQREIAKNGTKPSWFVLNSLPDIEAFLHANIQDAIQ